jgi:hypothetical protein
LLGRRNPQKNSPASKQSSTRSNRLAKLPLRAGDGATDAQKAKIAELTGRLYDMKNGTESAGKSTNGFRNALQQGGYQVQDFIVQVQGGQSALVAFSQQGSQLASVFSPVAGAVLTIATVIAGSLMASLSNGKNAIDAMKDAISAMDQVISVSSNGVAAYSDKFAALAKANTTVATLMRQQVEPPAAVYLISAGLFPVALIQFLAGYLHCAHPLPLVHFSPADDMSQV